MNSKTLTLSAVVLAVIIIVGAGIYFTRPTGSPAPTPTPQTTTTPNNSPITVSAPAAGALITSPYTISGQARGNWFFEASFPYELQDSHGTVIAQGHVDATSDWMTTDFVPFTATLTFTTPTTPTGELILHNDNPSGDPSKEQSILIPVRFQ